MATNPFAQRLQAFQSSVPNTRRGLRDIYKRRAGHYTEASKGTRTDIDAALRSLNTSYGQGLSAIDQYAGEARALIGRYGYDVDAGQTAELGAKVERGIDPLRDYTRGIGSGASRHFSDSKKAFLDYYRNAQEGLKREQPAAQSELESGILDVVGFLGQQSSQFAAQQALLAAQQQFYQQSLSAQNVGTGGATPTGGLSAAEQWIVQRESGGRTSAKNPTSSAFGLGQLILANRQRYAAQLGVDPWTTDYQAQLQMMRMYIKDRYGSAEQAVRFWQANGWY